MPFSVATIFHVMIIMQMVVIAIRKRPHYGLKMYGNLLQGVVKNIYGHVNTISSVHFVVH